VCSSDLGFQRASKEDIVGGTPVENAQLTKDILANKIQGPKRNIVCMNAGLGFYIYGKAASMEEGVKLADQIITEKKGLETLEKLIEVSNA